MQREPAVTRPPRSRFRGRACRRAERGSVLLLYPAGILVVIILGAMAVDYAIAFQAQRELANATTAVANDVAVEAISNQAFYQGGGRIVLSQQVVNGLQPTALVQSQLNRQFRGVQVQAGVSPDGRCVVLRAQADVDYIFAKAIPGASRSLTVHARAAAAPLRAAGASPCR